MNAGGISTSTRVLDAQARLENVRVQVLSLENQADSLKRELMNLIQNDTQDITPELTVFTVDSADMKVLCTLTVNSGRPELAALNLTSTQLSVYNKMLQGQKFPVLICSAGYRYAKPGLSLTGTEFMSYATAALQLKFNIFNGFRISSQQHQVHEQIDIVAKQTEQLISTWNNAIVTARMQFFQSTKTGSRGPQCA